MINIFYPASSEWEYDFFKNDLFPNEKVIIYNESFNFKQYSNAKNILVISKPTLIQNGEEEIPLFLKNIITILKPKCIFHLSDEAAKTQSYHNFYMENCKIVCHQYNSNKLKYTKEHYQIPLGYIQGFSNTLKYNENKKYDFSFVGQLKNDRIEMLDMFNKKYSKSFINVGNTNWNSVKNQKIQPKDLYDIYNNSIFVPIGRGNNSLDCFRLYECIIAGAIPVIVGDFEEIKETFDNNIPNILHDTSWNKVLLKCDEVYKNKDKQKEIILNNFEWWKDRICFIQKIIYKKIFYNIV